jgi:hypothetical protein
MAHLLFLDWITRDREDMAAAGEYSTSDAAIEGGEESDMAFFKGEDGIATAKLDAVGGSDAVDSGGIDAQSIDCIIKFVRWSFGGW